MSASVLGRIREAEEIVAAAEQFMRRLPAVGEERQAWLERQRRARRQIAMLTESERQRPALPKPARRFL